MAVAKYMARDAELLTAGCDPEGRAVAPWEVTQRLLRHAGAAFAGSRGRPWTMAGGVPAFGGGGQAATWGSPAGTWPQASALSSDCCRHWAPNGQCYYSDMSHWEGCTAETLDPLEYAAQCLSALQVAEAARVAAEADAEPGTAYTLSAHNVDGQDPAVSWGTHDNVHISRELWDDLFTDHRHPATLGFVASAMAAAVAWFGSGYLLPLSDGTTVYSLAGRAHHLGRLISEATTIAFQRALLNSRREHHAADGARLHLIGFDYGLASAALKCCFVQCFLAAAEEGFCDLMAFDPLRAVRLWSWGFDAARGRFTAEVAMTDGRMLSLPAYIRQLATRLLSMVEARLITPEAAPRAAELLPRIVECTRYAEEGALVPLARHSDWAATLLMIQGLCRRPGVRWGDAATVLANQDYANTDPARGLFWQLWDQGLVDPLVSRQQVEACLADGPAETRAWGRGRLVRKFGGSITGMDWSYVELRRGESSDRWSPRLRLEMPRLDALNRAELEPALGAARSVDELERLLERTEGAAVASDPVVHIARELAGDGSPETGPPRRGAAARPGQRPLKGTGRG